MQCPGVTDPWHDRVNQSTTVMEDFLMGHDTNTGAKLAFRNLNCPGGVRACHTHCRVSDVQVAYTAKNPMMFARVSIPP